MAIATLHRNIEGGTVTRTGPSLARRIIAFIAVLAEFWGETPALRREAPRRYPHLEF